MQRIIQVNLAGRVIAIEEDAYLLLRDYLSAMTRQFPGSEGKEIIEEIENRIAELFSIRLQSGAPAINTADVKKVIETLGAPGDLKDVPYSQPGNARSWKQGSGFQSGHQRPDRLLRDPYDKVVGGVCSGLGRYLDVDPVIIRLIMVILFLTFGVGIVAYIIAWAVIPAAQSRSELYGNPSVTFHDITRNVAMELDDLKVRAERMSRDLRDFFGRRR